MRQSGALTRGNDGFEAHAFRAVEAGLVLEFGGDFDFANAGADDGEDVLEEFAADESVLADRCRVRLRP